MSSFGSALVGLGAVGAALHILGSVLIVFGQASVKVAHAIVDSTGAPSTRRPDGKWRRQRAGSKAYAAGGWAAFAAGNILRFVAMRFAAQTVLSGLGSLQFVIIPVASRVMLGIRASGSTALGVTVVLMGNALIILYGPAEVTFTLEQLRHQWATPAMSTFLVALGSLLCVLQWLYWRLTSSGRGGAGSSGLMQPQVAAVMEGGGAKGAGLVDSAHLSGNSGADGGRGYLVNVGSGKWVDSPGASGGSGALPGVGGGGGGLAVLGLGVEADAVHVFAGALLFSAVASFVGAWSVLFSKSLTYVVSYMPGSLANWYSWFVLAAFLGTAAFWVRQSDRGLRYYPASLIMPLMQAFWMCMSVLEGGIYFDELTGLPSRHLALLLLGLMLALLGAIFMGIAGFIAEKPEHIFHYSAASHELDATEGALSPPPATAAAAATVSVIVEEEKLYAATGRIDQLSNPVLRATAGGQGGPRNGFHVGSTSSSDDGEAGKHWWRQQQQQNGISGGGGGVTRVHAIADGLLSQLELPSLVGAGSPLGGISPNALQLERMQAVCSPTQQLLSRENSGSLDSAVRGGSAFDRALLEAGGGSGSGALARHDTILLDELSSGASVSASSVKGPLQRR